MNFFVPIFEKSMIERQQEEFVDNQTSWKIERIKSKCFNYPYNRPSFKEENIFWNDVIAKFSFIGANRKNPEAFYEIDKCIYEHMIELIENDDISFYLAFKYFFNRILWDNGYYPHIKRVDDITFSPYHNGYERIPRGVIMNSGFMKVPLKLIPNLAYGLYKGCLNCSKIIEGDLSEVRNISFLSGPKLKAKKKISKKISLTEEYLSRENDDEEFIETETLISLLCKLNTGELKEIEKFVENV